jgi:hypothetical protein
MASPGNRGFRATLIAGGLMMAGGVALALYGHSLPVYTVPFEQATSAWTEWCNASGPDRAAGARYHALFGWHYALINAGSSIAAAGFTVALLAILMRHTAASGEPWLRTPERSLTFVAIGGGAMLLLWGGMIHGLTSDLDRRYFPACADSIAIPIFGIASFMTILIPILAAIGFVFTRSFGELPVRLDRWDRERPLRSWIVTLVFGAAMIGGLAIASLSIFSADLTTPSSVVILYLLAATRAAMLAPPRTSEENW